MHWNHQNTLLISWDYPFKGSQSLSNSRSPPDTAVSYRHSGVIKTTVLGTRVSKCCGSGSKSGSESGPFWLDLVPDIWGLDPDLCYQKFDILEQRCHWHRYVGISGIIDTAVSATAVSLIPLSNRLCRITLRIRRHFQKDFNPCVMGLGAVVWWKKPEAENLVTHAL
jgi:hypothetical protein